MSAAPEIFGVAPDGSPVHRVTLERAGARAAVMTWGASLQDFRIADAPHALVLGGPDFPAYTGPMRYFGAIVGRVANRIAGGRAPLDGRMLDLNRNEAGRTTLHGGAMGCAERTWRLEGHDARSCRMSLRMQDGEGGFPGNLDLIVTYALDQDGALEVGIEGRTDAPTFCNLAHHSYWNLDGAADLSGHRLRVAARRYLPVDEDNIPRGAPAEVAGTRFDFLETRAVTPPGAAPLDHGFCLDGGYPACVLSAGALSLSVSTTEPGLQVYDGAGLDTGAARTHRGARCRAHAGVALEPQGWPDAPNQPGYPSIILRPGETYRQISRFHIRRNHHD